MPIYEYQCPKCGKFEAIQKISDKPLKTHEACGSKVKKLLSAGAFAFKGSGFYITDYKQSADKSENREKKSDSPSCSQTKDEACKTCPSAGKAA